MVSVIIVLIIVALVGVWQISWLASVHEANATADLVALSAARAQAAHRDGCLEAEMTAARNHAQLEACELSVGYGEFIIDVTIRADIHPQVPGGPTRVEASARAGIVEDP